jgi:hypothetical protein
MRERILNIRTIVIVLALLTGVICSGFFPFMYLAFGAVIAMGLTVIGFIIDLITKSSKGIRVTGLIFFFFLIAALTSFATMKISEESATRMANKVIYALYSYKHKVGHFPKDINQLQLDQGMKAAFNKSQQYWTDSTMQQFEISGWSDGWNIKTFRSRDSTWVFQD